MPPEESSKFSPEAALKFLLGNESVNEDLRKVLEVLDDDQILALYCCTVDATDARMRRVTALASRHRGCIRSALAQMRYYCGGQLDLPTELERFRQRLIALSFLSSAMHPEIMRILRTKGISLPAPRRF